jgi:flagellin-like protein
MSHRGITDDTEAVSPVVGTILMVAIVIILAAVIATFLLGIGGQSQEPVQASLSFEFQENTTFNSSNVPPHYISYNNETDRLTITHESGDPIDSDRLRIEVEDTQVKYINSSDWVLDRGAGYESSFTFEEMEVGSEFTAGESITVMNYWNDSRDGSISMLREGSAVVVYEGDDASITIDEWTGAES